MANRTFVKELNYETLNPAITASSLLPTTTKGDIVVHSTTPARLPVGTNYQMLLADSTQTLGVKWGGMDVRYGVATANQSIPNSSYTAITFGSQTGSANCIPGSALPFAGTYLIYLQAAWDVNTVGSRYLEITVDGTRVIGSELTAQPSSFTTQTASRTIALNAGQVINFRAKQSSGGALNLVNNPDLVTPGITFHIIRLPV
jgi:hypothetical protein